MKRFHFEVEDLHDELPPPGIYAARICAARFQRRASGDLMLKIVFALRDVPSTYERVAEYFVLEGESRHEIRRARRELAGLYRACGLSPSAGDLISPAHLRGAVVEVEIAHEDYGERSHLQVRGHCFFAPRDPF